jgi:hypothetical protein
MPDRILSSLSVQGRTAMWDHILRQPAQIGSTTVRVVECDGEIIAFGSCGSQRSENLNYAGYDAEISALYVLKAFQRRGPFFQRSCTGGRTSPL